MPSLLRVFLPILASASATVAAAADMPLRSGDARIASGVEAPSYDWTGATFGVQAGWAGGSDKVGVGATTPLSSSARDLGDLGLRGGFVGLRAGYDVQSPFSPWVAGVAADVNLDGMRRSFEGAAGGVVAAGAARLDWDAALRLRLGYAQDRLLIYATAGAALAQEKYRVSVLAPLRAELRGSKTFLGATFGLGAEYALWAGMTVGLDYRYALFGGKTIAGAVVGGGVAQTHPSPNFHRLAASVNWRF